MSATRASRRCHRCGTRVAAGTRTTRTTRGAGVWHRLANRLRERADMLEKGGSHRERMQARVVRLRAAHYDRVGTILREGGASR